MFAVALPWPLLVLNEYSGWFQEILTEPPVVAGLSYGPCGTPQALSPLAAAPPPVAVAADDPVAPDVPAPSEPVAPVSLGAAGAEVAVFGADVLLPPCCSVLPHAATTNAVAATRAVTATARVVLMDESSLCVLTSS